MKYYVAYGSNLNREQMAHRCPEAKLVGTGMLSNYEMVFRGNKSNAVATVEPKKGMEVPVGIWEISARACTMSLMCLIRHRGETPCTRTCGRSMTL